MNIFIKIMAFLTVVGTVYELWSPSSWWIKKFKSKKKSKTNVSSDKINPKSGS